MGKIFYYTSDFKKTIHECEVLEETPRVIVFRHKCPKIQGLTPEYECTQEEIICSKNLKSYHLEHFFESLQEAQQHLLKVAQDDVISATADYVAKCRTLDILRELFK